jgi:predicted alpha/beta superfamily hydrolase
MVFGFICTLALVATAISSVSAAPPEVDRQVVTSRILGEDRPFNIVLPAGYSAEKTYPVVYALDGGARYTPTLAEQMQAAHADLIVVGIENVDRDRDMFPEPLPARQNRGGGGERFLEFITKELIPYIENRYSVNDFRVISGQSNSGFFVLYAMLTAPDAFDAYLASSPMIGWDWDMIRTESVGLLKGSQSFPKVLFMNRGDDDYAQVTDYLPAYAALLLDISPTDFRWKNEVVAGGGHVPANSYEDGIAYIFRQ